MFDSSDIEFDLEPWQSQYCDLCGDRLEDFGDHETYACPSCNQLIAASESTAQEMPSWPGSTTKSGPVFNLAALRTMGEAREILESRGNEYQDSWALENMHAIFTENTLRAFGYNLDPDQIRLVVLAALIDVKDSRMIGDWKTDTVVDGINYRAAYAALRDDYEYGDGDGDARDNLV